MTDFRNAMKAATKGKAMVSRRGWNGSGYVVKGKAHPMFMQNGTWDTQRWEPSFEDIFATDWVVTESKD